MMIQRVTKLIEKRLNFFSGLKIKLNLVKTWDIKTFWGLKFTEKQIRITKEE